MCKVELRSYVNNIATGSSGTFTLSLPPGSYQFVAAKTGYIDE